MFLGFGMRQRVGEGSYPPVFLHFEKNIEVYQREANH